MQDIVMALWISLRSLVALTGILYTSKEHSSQDLTPINKIWQLSLMSQRDAKMEDRRQVKLNITWIVNDVNRKMCKMSLKNNLSYDSSNWIHFCIRKSHCTCLRKNILPPLSLSHRYGNGCVGNTGCHRKVGIRNG